VLPRFMGITKVEKMCSFNVRNCKQCQEDPKHTFKEVRKCAEAGERENDEACLEEYWEDLRNVFKSSTSIVCPVCNDMMFILPDAADT
jgi:hypothetical protein